MALPPADPDEGLSVVLWNGADVAPRYRNRELIVRVKPPDALPPGPSEPTVIRLAGWDHAVAVVKVVVSPDRKRGNFHYVARWDAHHGWRSNVEDIREGQESAAAAFLSAVQRGRSVGRPRGSGTAFRDSDDFLDRVSEAIGQYRNQNNGRDPSQSDIAKQLNVHAKTIRRHTQTAGYASWRDLITAV